LIAQNKYSKAESIAYQTISTDYYNYYANLRLAYVLRMEKKYDLAVQINNKMLTVYPTDVNFLSELGLNKHAQDDIKGAADIFWNVLVLDPENTTAKEYLKEDGNNN
jgi:tetratricopeptide (TPR) repeat protein